MKIKDLIKHLQTLDGEKELVVIGTDPTGWDYGMVVTPADIKLDTVIPCEDNGLEGELILNKFDEDLSEDEDEEGNPIVKNNVSECYVINIDC